MRIVVSRIKLVVGLIVFFVLPLSAQNAFNIWDGVKSVPKYKKSELTAFIPEKQDTSGISVIICPGGSYYWLDMNNEGFSVAKYLNSRGITAFVLHYRTARNNIHHPAMIQDLQRSLQLVKENSKSYNINPDKVGVMGFSAGGHLSGLAAEYFDTNSLESLNIQTKTSLKPYFAAMIYPVISMEDSIGHLKSRSNLLGKNYSVETAKSMSLEQNVRVDMPPIFLLHLIGDKTVDYRNSVVFEKALKEKKIKHKFILLDEYGHWGHGFGIQPIGKATGWIDVFVEWLVDLNENKFNKFVDNNSSNNNAEKSIN